MKCKSKLNDIQSGDTMEVLIADPEVVKDLEKIIERSKDRITHRVEESDHYRLRILKG
jgi:TusA-related sulfurtransferase